VGVDNEFCVLGNGNALCDYSTDPTGRATSPFPRCVATREGKVFDFPPHGLDPKGRGREGGN